jgi:predicted XRE-type DNA-binding protein
MTLVEWMEKNKVSKTELARRIGVTVPMVYHVLSGKKEFGKANMMKIVEITKGKVTLKDLIGTKDVA